MESRPTQHVPVLLDEVLEGLAPRPGQIIVDGTLGGGGHARALAERVAPTGRVIGLDRDRTAVERARAVLADLPVTAVAANYRDLREVLDELEIAGVDGVLLDLGLSSDQLADPARGFSFDSTGALDLRFDTADGPAAAELVNTLSERELADLIYRYGEERLSRRIARRVVERRRLHAIETSNELADIVRRAYGGPAWKHRIDPATRTFQALRIAVNGELESLELILRDLPLCLNSEGRVAIISFHSLEDRLVKQAFRDDPRYEPLTRKPVQASSAEIERNPRARSAKLRVAAVHTKSPGPRSIAE